jgi:hypothetical protein
MTSGRPITLRRARPITLHRPRSTTRIQATPPMRGLRSPVHLRATTRRPHTTGMRGTRMPATGIAANPWMVGNGIRALQC